MGKSLKRKGQAGETGPARGWQRRGLEGVRAAWKIKLPPQSTKKSLQWLELWPPKDRSTENLGMRPYSECVSLQV